MAHLLLRGQLLRNNLGHPAAIDAVLFDKDGTLSISEPMLQTLAQARVLACLELLAERHPELTAAHSQTAALQDLLQRAYGLTSTGAVHPAGTTAVGSRAHNLISTATVLAQVGLGWPEALELAEDVFAGTDGLHGQGSPQRPQATDGLHDLIGQLTAAGVRCAVISNDEIPGIEAFLQSHALAPHFDELWSAEHTPRKPDPAAVHGLCALLGVAPERCALIGDANSDLRMARAAGVPVVLGYTAAWRTTPELDPSFEQLQHWCELQVGLNTSAPHLRT